MRDWKRPRSIDVLGTKYKIRYRNFSKEDYEGHIVPEERTIYVHNGHGKDATYEIIRHEVMHALLMLSGISEGLQPEQEEALCVLMETGYKALIIQE
jgi:hypothetical protein